MTFVVYSLPREEPVLDRLIAIWSEVLVCGVVNVDSDYVELGGSSLTAVRIRVQVRTLFGRDVPLADILEYRTPRQLAALLPDAPVVG